MVVYYEPEPVAPEYCHILGYNVNHHAEQDLTGLDKQILVYQFGENQLVVQDDKEYYQEI